MLHAVICSNSIALPYCRIESLPTDLLDYMTGLGFTLSENLQDAALGYPIGLSLHILSLLSHLASPTSDLSIALLFGIDASSTQAASVFGGAGSAGSVKGKGGLKDLRKAAKAARVNAWSWLVSRKGAGQVTSGHCQTDLS